MAISYPFCLREAVHQPMAHGDHPHLGGGLKRRSLEDLAPPRPPLTCPHTPSRRGHDKDAEQPLR